MKIKMTRQIATIIILALSVMAIFGGRWITGFYGKGHKLILENKKSKGNPDAGIKIVEYTDFQCSACSVGANVLHEFMNLYSDQIFLTYRHYPLPSLHPYAVKMATYAECSAKQEKFWAYHDYLFENARVISRSISPVAKMLGQAEQMQLDMEKFKVCVESSEAELTVLQEKDAGKKLGVRATPTYFLNGEMVVGSGNIKKELEKILGIPTKAPKDEKN